MLTGATAPDLFISSEVRMIADPWARAADLLDPSSQPLITLGEAARDPKLIGAYVNWWPKQKWLLDQIDNPDIHTHFWALGRQAGKTTIAAAAAIHNAAFRPDLDAVLPKGRIRYILIAGAVQSQAREFLRVVKGMLDQMDLPCEYEPLQDRIDFRTADGRLACIEGISSTSPSVRGKSASMLVFDEFAHINQLAGHGADERLWAAVTPSTRAFGPLAITLVISTPMGRTNKFADLFTQASDGILDGASAVQGSVSEIVPEIDPKWLEQKRMELGESLFAQEYLADFIASGGAFFDLSRVQFEETAAFPEECDMWMGALDPAFHADSFGYALIGRSRAEPGRWLLGPVGEIKPEGEAKTFDARRGREDRTLQEAFERLAPYEPVKLLTDQHQAVAVQAFFGHRGVHVETLNVTGNIQTAAFTSLRQRLNDGSLRAWREPQLLEGLRRTRARENNKIALASFGDSHCDAVMALALAVYGADMGGGMPMLTVGPSLSTGRTARQYGPSEFS